MPFLLILSSLLAVSLLGGVLLRSSWGHRYPSLPLVVLAAPMVSLGLSAWTLGQLVWRVCWIGAAPGTDLLGLALPIGMALVALGALAVGLVRLGLLWRCTGRRSLPAPFRLRSALDRVARRFGMAPPLLVVVPSHRPLAHVYGLPGNRSRLVVSTWVPDHLDPQEVEGVLAHELAHLARGDHAIAWLALLLRDAFCYLPSSRAAFRRLQQQQELVCDDLAAGVTGRPLALASALAKVWQGALGAPAMPAAGVGLAGAHADLEGRIRRLLDGPGRASGVPGHPRVALVGAGGTTAAVFGLQAMNLALLVLPLGCGSLLRMLGW